MAYVKAPIPTEVYHLTQLDKLDGILNENPALWRYGMLVLRKP